MMNGRLAGGLARRRGWLSACSRVAVLAALVWIWLTHGALAQPADTAAAPPTAQEGAEGQESESPQGIWGVLTAGGPVGISVGMVIVLLSIAAVALVIEHIMTIREPVLMPPGLGEEVRKLLAEGKLAPAQKRCRMDPSFLAYVLEAGLAEADGGWPAVEKAMEDAAADQSARLFRKIEYLSVIGNIAPMLGLLGTVIGMILAFHKVATTPGAVQPSDLAGGIYLALVTTVEGLIVAIPSLAAFAVFRNRVDQLVAEAAYVAQHVFTPLKRTRAAERSKGALPPAPPPVGGR